MAKRSFLDQSQHEDSPGADRVTASRTLIERAYAQLREDIVDGHLAPGEKLRVEHLKDHYAVSAGTLREAITRLVSDALVVAEGQRGFRVAPMALDDLQDLTRLRLHIEIEALRLSIRMGDAAWRVRVQAAFDELSSVEQPLSLERAKRWEHLNNRFHAELISGCNSPWTRKVLQQLAQHSERYRRWALGLPDTGRNVHAEHTEIFELTMDGQEARAALALEAHISATPNLLLRHVHQGWSPPPPAPGATVNPADNGGHA